MNEIVSESGTYIINEDDSRKTGKFSSIKIGRRSSDNTKVIIKQLKDSECVGDEKTQKIIHSILTNLHTLNPLISQTFDVLKNEGGAFVIREYIDGVDLKTLVYDKRYAYFRTPDFTAKVGVSVCEMLSAIHSNGLVHRDIKPANIMVEFKKGTTEPDYYNPVVRLIDFELAQIHGINIFTMGKVPVAMVYSAPEQLLRCQHLIDPTSDLFSLAVTLYEFLSGKLAFNHNNPELLMNLQLNHPLIKHVKIPHQLFAILHKATQKQPFQLPPNRYSYDERELILMKGKEQRFGSAVELKMALEGFLMKYDAIPPAKNVFGKVRAFFR